MDGSDEDEMATRRRRVLGEAQEQLESLDTCIQEIELLRRRMPQDSPQPTGLPTHIRSLNNDGKALQGLINGLATDTQMSDDALKSQIRKLNNVIQEAARDITHWSILKRCRSFVATKRAFQSSTKEERRRKMAEERVPRAEKGKMHRMWKEKGRVEVDVVDGGYEWIVFKTTSRDRLAREMADGGWAWGEHERGHRVARGEWEDISLAKQALKLVAGARMNRFEYDFPRIRIVLPSLSRGEEEFDVLFEQLTSLDPLVKVIIEDMNGEFLKTPPPDLDTAITNLVGDDLSGLTPTLNLDHTILIDLISDLTHKKLVAQPWQAPSTRTQIEDENAHEGGLMARTLYPLLEGRELICTMEAAEHFHEVLKTVGTKAEKQRGRLLVPVDEQTKSMTPEEIRAAFQKLSIYPLPANVQLPITILRRPWTLDTVDAAVQSGALPAVATSVARHSSWKSAKLSIFVYGWASGNLTLTSNKEIRAHVRTLVEEHRQSDEERGPGIWRFGVTRNLLAKYATPRGETDDEDEDEDEDRDEG